MVIMSYVRIAILYMPNTFCPLTANFVFNTALLRFSSMTMAPIRLSNNNLMPNPGGLFHRLLHSSSIRITVGRVHNT